MSQAAAVGAAWSRCGGADCIRLRGLAPGTDVQVQPVLGVGLGTELGLGGGRFPAMAGHLVRDGDDVCFVPRFGFVDGTTYTVAVAGQAAAVLTRPRPERPAVTEVLAIYPTVAEVPRNLLRFYIWFSAPMSEGYAARHVRLTGAAGNPVAGALLPTDSELWSSDRCRLTVLLDPARIKRGLAAHRQAGYPLRRGHRFRIVVDDGFPDALGSQLRRGAERLYTVGADERRHVDPGAWAIRAPAGGTRESLKVTFDRPLDHGLLARCLHVTGPGGQPVPGAGEPGLEERSWRLTPHQPWTAGAHQLAVDPVLEDLAGNSVTRVFDRDLARPQDQPRQSQPVSITFHPH